MSGFFSLVHNIGALNISNTLNTNETGFQEALQRLSTGLRINSAKDDPSGLAVSTRLQFKDNVLQQAQLNAADGNSLIQVANSGLQQIQQVLQRLSALATEATDGSKSTTDLQDIQNEVNQLVQEINQIVGQTQFGNTNLLDGTIAGAASAVSGCVVVSSNAILPGSGNSLINNVGVATASLLFPNSNVSCFLDEAFRILITPSTVSASSFVVNVFASQTITAVAGFVPDTTPIATIFLAPTLSATQSALVPITITSSAVGGATFVATLNFQGITVSDIQNIVGQNSYITTQAFQSAITTDKSLLEQIGASVGQNIRINAAGATASVLFNGQNLNVLTNLSAEGALNMVQTALTQVTTQESQLGATQVRIQAIEANNTVLDSNIQSAISAITDINVAQETTNLTRQQILVSSAQAMLTQANGSLAPLAQLIQNA